MTDPEALDAIRRVMATWAGHGASDEDTIGAVIEILEAAGRPIVKGVDAAANDVEPS